MNFWQRVWSVARRELRIWQKRPVYLFGSVVVMAFMTIFYLTFFHEGTPEDMPVGVVDMDHSSISRMFAQQLDATQIAKVVHYDTFADAREDLQGGNIYSMLVLPRGMMDDIQSFRQPKLSFYVNGLYYIGGALTYKQLQEMVNLASGAVRRETLRLKGMNEYEIMDNIMPVYFDLHYIGNPGANIGNYLCNTLLPGMLELVIIIVLIYSLGSELKYGTSKHLIANSKNIYTALFGKTLVYTVLFTLIGWTLQVIMYKWMHFPLAGSLGEMMLIMLLFVLACESVAVFIMCMVPVLRLGLSIGALYSVLGLSLCGFTLPVEMMPPLVQGLAYTFPLTFYYRAGVQIGIFDSGMAGWYPYALVLLCFQLAAFVGLKRLADAYTNLNYPRN